MRNFNVEDPHDLLKGAHLRQTSPTRSAFNAYSPKDAGTVSKTPSFANLQLVCGVH